MKATEGLSLVTEMVTNNWLGEVSGLSYRIVSFGVKHSIVNGKPYYFNDYQIRKINTALIYMSDSINNFKMFNNMESFHALRIFGKKIKLSYLFQTVMGKTQKWQAMHMHMSNDDRYYGNFTDKDVCEIRLALKQMAARLMSIELICDKPE